MYYEETNVSAHHLKKKRKRGETQWAQALNIKRNWSPHIKTIQSVGSKTPRTKCLRADDFGPNPTASGEVTWSGPHWPLAVFHAPHLCCPYAHWSTLSCHLYLNHSKLKHTNPYATCRFTWMPLSVLSDFSL